MTDSFDQLMAAVLQAPREDAPRLRLADWLIARGDPRGEFIRAQIERARLGPDAAEADRLARRERELLARHEAEWVGPLAGGLIGWRFRRGFIEEVTLDAELLLAHAEDLFGAAPIESLRVHEAGGVSDELAACPYLDRVSRLHVGSEDGDGEPLGDDGLAALAGSPHLTQLAGLSFGMEQFDGDGLQALAGAPWVHGLRSLGLANNEIGDAALASFLAGASLQNLEFLNLDWTGAGVDTVAVLAQSAALGALRRLVLANNEIGGAGLAVLAGATGLHLTALGLGCTYLESGSLQPLGGSALLARLRELSLWANNELEPGDLSGLLASSSFPPLQALVLGNVKFGDTGAEIVAEAEVLRSLTRLEFRGSRLSGAGVQALAGSPHLSGLEALEVVSNPEAGTAAEAMAVSPTLANLRTLTLTHDQIPDEGAQALAEAAHLTRLRSLSLRSNRLTVNGVASLTASAALRQLRSLDLGYMSLTDNAVSVLSGATGFSNLATLGLASNKINCEGARALAASAGLACLAELDLRRNSIDADGAAALRSTFGRCVRLDR